MFTFLSNLHIDRLSFWIGFITASLFWWVAFRSLALGRVLQERIKARLAEIERQRKAGMDGILRRETLRRVQEYHLASPLFSLEEIAIPPLVLPPFQASNADGTLSPHEDLLRTTLPLTPDWPELNSHYPAPKLTLAQALSGGVSLAVTGQPGSGKTFALAHLATLVSRRDPSTGDLANRLPLFLHVSDLHYPSEPAEIEAADPADILIAASSNGSSLFLQPQIAAYLSKTLTNGQVLLILDGADELPLAYLKGLVVFLKTLLARFPGNQVVMAANPDNLDGLVSSSIRPVALCSWTNQDRQQFVEKWASLWQQAIEPSIARQMNRDPLNLPLLKNWILADRSINSPLEMTLKVWAVFAGDSHGLKGFQAIEAYLSRLVPDEKLLVKVCNLALQETLAGRITFTTSHATTILTEPETSTGSPSDASAAQEKAAAPGEPGRSVSVGQTPAQADLYRLISQGLLVERQNDALAFSHPVIMGYLASRSAIDNAILNNMMGQPLWIGKTLFLHYLATIADISSQVEALINHDTSDPLLRNTLTVARWLSDTPANVPWRAQLMRRLLAILQNDRQPPAVRARSTAAFIASNDPSLQPMFHQLLVAPSGVIRQFSALASGILQDTKSTRELSGLLADPTAEVRYAACMALVAIGTPQSVNPVLELLGAGDEELSRVAAEAFATQPETGHAILKECTTHENLLVRRASVFGLAKVNQPWALDLLKHIQIEDAQWVVRNAASHVVDMLQKPDPAVPHPLLLPHDSPWLIEYASKQGVGIIPGDPATEMLLKALDSGSIEEKMAALEYLAQKPPDKDLIYRLQQMIENETGLLGEAVAYAIWLLLACGGVLKASFER